MLCTAIARFRILTYSSLCYFMHMPVCSMVFSIIKAYSCILRHYYGIFRLFQTYSAPCVTLAYSQPCHVLNPGIVRTGYLFKTLWNVDQAYLEPCYRALFSHIQAYSELCATRVYDLTYSDDLVYPESWNIQKSSIIVSRRTYRTLSYLRKFNNIQTHI